MSISFIKINCFLSARAPRTTRVPTRTGTPYIGVSAFLAGTFRYMPRLYKRIATRLNRGLRRVMRGFQNLIISQEFFCLEQPILTRIH
jgi:hypothetical protein